MAAASEAAAATADCGGDGRVCALRSCGKPIAGHSYVGIRAVRPALTAAPPPPKRGKKKSAAAGASSGASVIAWNAQTGAALLHRACWELVDPTGGPRERLRPRARFHMSAEERKRVAVAAKTVEFFDAPSLFAAKVARAAELVAAAAHVVVFTGAGISTSAGIGDYRGPSGAWTAQDCGQDPDEITVNYEALRPTLTHELLRVLAERGVVKFLISQNADGLHGLSGFPRDMMAELHGNVFVEHCPNCGEVLLRPWYTLDDEYDEKAPGRYKCERCGISHATRRHCEHCGHRLMDTIVNFGDDLPAEVIGAAEAQARACDLMICLGSSLLVTPACELLELGDHKLIIVNRQTTGFDTVAERNGVRAFGDTDDFLSGVVKQILGDLEFTSMMRSLANRSKAYDAMRQPDAPAIVLHEGMEPPPPLPCDYESDGSSPTAAATQAKKKMGNKRAKK